MFGICIYASINVTNFLKGYDRRLTKSGDFLGEIRTKFYY